MLVAEKSHAALVPAALAAGMAAGAAVLLQLSALAALAPDGITEALWLLGWAVAVGSALSTLFATVLLLRQKPAAGSARASILLVGAAVALLAIVAWLHPFMGSGGGAG